MSWSANWSAISASSLAGAGILLGDRLGLYKAMADGRRSLRRARQEDRPARALCARVASGQAAAGYIDYDAEKKRSRCRPSRP